jgi:hypothetical protein
VLTVHWYGGVTIQLPQSARVMGSRYNWPNVRGIPPGTEPVTARSKLDDVISLNK